VQCHASIVERYLLVLPSTQDPLRMLVRDWWLFEADQSWAFETPKEKWDLPY
jgi:hypothetical protein